MENEIYLLLRDIKFLIELILAFIGVIVVAGGIILVTS